MFSIYRFEPNDSLEKIAQNFNISIGELMEINNLNRSSILRAGDEIIVPTSSKQYFEYYTIQKGDSLYQIAKKYNINPKLLAALNGIDEEDYIYPNQMILIPKANYSYYVTKDGDTIDNVAKMFGVSRDKILNDNNSIYLLEGQLLVKNNG